MDVLQVGLALTLYPQQGVLIVFDSALPGSLIGRCSLGNA